MNQHDRDILAPLIESYLKVCDDPAQKERKDSWRKLNGLNPSRPMVYARRFAWQEMPECRRECSDPLLGSIENGLRRKIFWSTLGDDAIFEPWLAVGAVHKLPDGRPFPDNPIKDTAVWGPEIEWVSSGPGGAKRWIPPLKELADIDRMVTPRHIIDEEATRARVSKVQEAVDDLIQVTVDRGPAYRGYLSDISTHLALLRGMEQMMLDMIDNPVWLHRILAFMRDGILAAQEEAERAGDWCLTSQFNQAETYAAGMADPAPDACGVSRDQLWAFCAAQEYALVSPDMFDEFLLQYQIPILKNFGLVHYGCCEVLTRKIKQLRKIPNLRRIGIGLNADVAACAEQIGSDYVLSYRPSPAEMVSFESNPEKVQKILRRDLAGAKGCAVDITLKDVETVQGDPERVRRWVQITRDVIDELGM